jgi:hypothetical protein
MNPVHFTIMYGRGVGGGGVDTCCNIHAGMGGYQSIILILIFVFFMFLSHHKIVQFYFACTCLSVQSLFTRDERELHEIAIKRDSRA